MQGITFELDEEMCADDEEREALQEIVNNTKLTEGYLTLARDIEVMEPKSPEDIYKVHVLAIGGPHGQKLLLFVTGFGIPCFSKVVIN